VPRTAANTAGCPQDGYDLTFHVERIVASRHRQNDDPSNPALVCNKCNHHKGPNLSSVDWESGSAEITRLFHPRNDRWEDHFEWHGSRLHGKTPIGRVTVLCLGINLPHRVAFREVLANE
jgi:hypothetical protein